MLTIHFTKQDNMVTIHFTKKDNMVTIHFTKKDNIYDDLTSAVSAPLRSGG
jgi:hypothetical protein